MNNHVKLFTYGFLMHAATGLSAALELVGKTALILYTRTAVAIDGPLPEKRTVQVETKKVVN